MIKNDRIVITESAILTAEYFQKMRAENPGEKLAELFK